jgi:hypothetical protein
MGRGADRIQKCHPTFTISPLGRKVADLLDAAWDGIYHLPESLPYRAGWDDPYFISVVVPDYALATYDFNTLTRLVVLCHDAALRMEIDSANPRNVRLTFHQRKRTGGVCEGHPTLEEAAAAIRNRHHFFLEEHEVKA